MKKLQFILQVEYDQGTRWEADSHTFAKAIKARTEIAANALSRGTQPTVEVFPLVNAELCDAERLCRALRTDYDL